LASYESQDKLKQGIEAIRKGDKVTAQRLLRQVVDRDAKNEVAWMWYASTLDNLQERRQALEMVLRLNPSNARAREALNQLNDVLGVPAGKGGRKAASGGGVSRGGTGNTVLVTSLAALLGLGVLVLIIFSIVNSQAPRQPTAATQIAIIAVPTETPTINPADYTATPFYGVFVTPNPANLPVFPPTFTPTFTPTVITATPTITPYPRNFFSLFFTSVVEDASDPALFRMNGDGSEEREVDAGDSGGYYDVAYSPDQASIAFIRTVTYTNDAGEEVTTPELFIGPVDNPTSAAQITRFGGDLMASPAWSPDGLQLVLVSNFDGDEELWLVNRDGTNVVQLTINEAVDRQPTWSPDGSTIVYASDQASAAGSNLFELYAVSPLDEDGSTIRQLTDADGSSYSPSWSPDGRLIVFASNRTGDGDIYLIDADGTNARLMTSGDDGAEDRIPVFTPDGENIIFASNRDDADGRSQLYLTDLTGTRVERLTDSGVDIVSFSFRPEPLVLSLRTR
jgi:hypothetical protein